MTQEKEQLRTQLCNALMYLCVPEKYEEPLKKLSEDEKKYNSTYFAKKNVFKQASKKMWLIGVGTFITHLSVCILMFILIAVLIRFLAFSPYLTADIIPFYILYGINVLSRIALFVFLPFLFISIPISAPISAMIYWRSYKKKHADKATQYWKEVATPAIQKIRQQIREIEDERDRFLNEYAYVLDFLPEDYRDVMAVGYMEECIRNLRADTLKEAINLYEEQKHRWTLENLSQQMLAETELHNQIMQAGFQAIYDEQRRTTAMATNIRNLTLFNTMRDIHKEIKSS